MVKNLPANDLGIPRVAQAAEPRAPATEPALWSPGMAFTEPGCYKS